MVVRSSTERQIIERFNLPTDISGGEIISKFADRFDRELDLPLGTTVQNINRERRSVEFQERMQAEVGIESDRERLGRVLQLSPEDTAALTARNIAEIDFKRFFRGRTGRPPTDAEVIQELERVGIIRPQAPDIVLPPEEPEIQTGRVEGRPFFDITPIRREQIVTRLPLKGILPQERQFIEPIGGTVSPEAEEARLRFLATQPGPLSVVPELGGALLEIGVLRGAGFGVGAGVRGLAKVSKPFTRGLVFESSAILGGIFAIETGKQIKAGEIEEAALGITRAGIFASAIKLPEGVSLTRPTTQLKGIQLRTAKPPEGPVAETPLRIKPTRQIFKEFKRVELEEIAVKPQKGSTIEVASRTGQKSIVKQAIKKEQVSKVKVREFEGLKLVEERPARVEIVEEPVSPFFRGAFEREFIGRPRTVREFRTEQFFGRLGRLSKIVTPVVPTQARLQLSKIKPIQKQKPSISLIQGGTQLQSAITKQAQRQAQKQDQRQVQEIVQEQIQIQRQVPKQTVIQALTGRAVPRRPVPLVGALALPIPSKRKPIVKGESFAVDFKGPRGRIRRNPFRFSSRKAARKFAGYMVDVSPDTGFKVTATNEKVNEPVLSNKIKPFSNRRKKFDLIGGFFTEKKRSGKDSIGERLKGKIVFSGGAGKLVTPKKTITLLSKKFGKGKR